jgi:hypothetical protein
MVLTKPIIPRKFYWFGTADSTVRPNTFSKPIIITKFESVMNSALCKTLGKKFSERWWWRPCLIGYDAVYMVLVCRYQCLGGAWSLHFEGSRIHSGSRNRVVSIETMLRAGRSGVLIPAEARDFYLLQNVQTGSQDHPASTPSGTGVLPGDGGRGLQLTAHLHLVTRSRMSGATPLLPLSAFMVWTGKTLFHLPLRYVCTRFNTCKNTVACSSF